jgi:hypothetical protein
VIKYVKSLSWQPCKNNFQLHHKKVLPQQQKFDKFINDHCIIDIHRVDVNNFRLPNKLHNMIVFIVNPNDLISLQSVDGMLVALKEYAKNYYYIAVNKFLVYTEHDTPVKATTFDFDKRLVDHWTHLLNLDVVWTESQSSDRGHLGNFVHPVTTMLFKL